jgi:hypothetical protein
MIKISDKLLKTSINEVAATDSGKILIAALKDACRWDDTYLSSEDPQVTQFFAAQRGIYGALRKLIKIEHLKQIEFNYKREENDDRTQPTSKRISKPSDRSAKPSDKSTSKRAK